MSGRPHGTLDGSPAADAVILSVPHDEAPRRRQLVKFADTSTKPKGRRSSFALRRIQSIDSTFRERNAPRKPAQLSSDRSSGQSSASTCAEPNHEELLESVSAVLHRRIEENEQVTNKREIPLFCEDTHTRPPRPDTYEVAHPLLLARTMSMPTLFGVCKLPQPAPSPQAFSVPPVRTIVHFLKNIWKKARLTPHCVIICLVYVDRLESKSEEGVLLHARSWRPIIFSCLLLASKVWHDVSYWNSDFSTICPMFTVRNVNKLERCVLELLQYDTIISSSQYAQYYFSLRQASMNAHEEHRPRKSDAIPSRGGDNFRTKLMMSVGVPAANRMRMRSVTLANHEGASAARRAAQAFDAAEDATSVALPLGVSLDEDDMLDEMSAQLSGALPFGAGDGSLTGSY